MMRREDRRGILNDWDLAKRTTLVIPRQHERTVRIYMVIIIVSPLTYDYLALGNLGIHIHSQPDVYREIS